MTCPRCKTGVIDELTRRCTHCGAAAPESETLDLPAVDDLEQNIRKLLGKDYLVEGLIGRGGMSLVYLARELELNRVVALKVLPLQLSFGPGAAERFKREAKIAANLDHPHIIPIYRVGSVSTLLWYAMKYVKGQTLAQMLRERGALPLDAVLDIVGQIAGGLEYAHRRGVIHRDVKPENVMIDEQGWCWVCDFGVAKAFGALPLTQTGGTLGTPGYMSPEQCLGHTLDARSDQYSLAILTYECLAGKRPFDADSLGGMIQKHCSEPPPRLSEVKAGIPQQVSDALIRALSKKPADRFESVAAFVQAMGGKIVLRGSEAGVDKLVHVSADTPTPVPSPRVRKRRLASYAIAAGGTLAVVAAILWVPRGSGTAPQEAATSLPLSLPRPESTATAATAPLTTAAETTSSVTASPAPASVPAARDDPMLQPVELMISSTPWGDLYIDGRHVGYTSTPGHKIMPGRRHIRISRDLFQTYDTVITVAPGRPVRLTGITLQPIGR